MEVKTMKKYVCDVCGWVYDEALGAPDQGIASKVPIRASGGKHPPEAFFLPLRASY